MMIGLVLPVLGIVSVTVVGVLAILPMKRSLQTVEFIALGFGVGSGAATLCFFIVSAMGVPLSGLTMALVLVAAILVLSAFQLVTKPDALRMPRMRFGKPSIGVVDGLLILGIALVLASAAIIAIYWPPYTWDALAIWVGKARAIAVSQTIQAIEHGGAHPYYPLHLPLELSFFLNLTEVDRVKLLFPLYYAALLIMFGTTLDKLCHRVVGLGFTLGLATVPFLLYNAMIAYADLTFAFYYVSSTLLLYRFTKASDARERSDLLTLSGLMTGIAAWTRPEGPMYFAINCAVLMAFSLRKSVRPALLLEYGIAFAIFAIPWMMYARVAGHQNYLLEHLQATVREIVSLHIYWDRIWSILAYFGEQATDLGAWGGLWILSLFALVLYPGRIRKDPFLATLIGLNILGLILTYYATAASEARLGWWLMTGFNRMALHFAPLLLFYCAISFNEDLETWVARSRFMVKTMRNLAKRRALSQ